MSNRYAFSLRKRHEGQYLTFSTRYVQPSPAAEECIDKQCPHITDDGCCPYWGAWDQRIKRVVVDEMWRRGGCCFYKWGKEGIENG